MHRQFSFRARRTLLVVLLLAVAACSRDRPTAPASARRPDVRAAFRLDVDLARGTVAINAPAVGASAWPGAPTLSIVGPDGIQLKAGTVTRQPTGSTVRVTFDLALLNRSSLSELITPTWPQVPGGKDGLVLIPLALDLGNNEVVDAGMRASADWDGDGTPGSGAPANFFNDYGGCKGNQNTDCVRWELYQQPLAPGAISESHTVGFVVPATVQRFSAFLVLAADRRDVTQASVAGLVTANNYGPIPGVMASASGPSGLVSTVTDAAGRYALAGLPYGLATIRYSQLPAGCVGSSTRDAAVPVGGNPHADAAFDCSSTVTGQLAFVDGGGFLPNQIVSLGGPTQATDNIATFTFNNVLAGPHTPSFSPGMSWICTPSFSPSTVSVPLGVTTVAQDLALDCQRRIVGEVEDQWGNQIGQLGIEISGASGARLARAGTSSGLSTSLNFAMSAPAGVRRLTVDATAQPNCVAPAPQQLFVRPDEIIPGDPLQYVNLTLTCQANVLTGTVSNADGPMSGVQVTLISSAATGRALTDDAGQYRITSLPRVPHAASPPIILRTTALPLRCTGVQAATALDGYGITGRLDVLVDCARALDLTLLKSTGGAAAGVQAKLSSATFVTTGQTAGNGLLSLGPVPAAGAYTLAFTQLPAGCAAPASVPVTLGQAGLTLTITLTCQ